MIRKPVRVTEKVLPNKGKVSNQESYTIILKGKNDIFGLIP